MTGKNCSTPKSGYCPDVANKRASGAHMDLASRRTSRRASRRASRCSISGATPKTARTTLPALRAVPSSSFRTACPTLGGAPEPFDEAARAFKVWDAWYTGDQDELFNYYSSDIAPTRPIQYRSGFRGKVARFFWVVRVSRPPSVCISRLLPTSLAPLPTSCLPSLPVRVRRG